MKISMNKSETVLQTNSSALSRRAMLVKCAGIYNANERLTLLLGDDILYKLV